jgi:outer membrane protein assembly factor BamB
MISCSASTLLKTPTVWLPCFLGVLTSAVASAASWPQFRGPDCSGVAVEATPPVVVSPTNRVLWSIDVPWSPSSPCIWGERLFLTTFDEGQLQTRCYNLRDGKLVWSSGIRPEKLEAFHTTENSPAAPTPATDGTRIVSYFGSFGLVCYDLKGKELWRRPLAVAISGGGFGTGTSPVIVGGLVILDRDQDQNSSLLAVDVATGKTIWETARPDATGSFGTPVIWRNDGVDEVVVPGCLRLKGYDLKTGSELWTASGTAAFTCTTPVVGDGWLYYAAWSPGKTDAPWASWEAFLARYDKNKDGAVTPDEFPESERPFMSGADANHDGKITKEDWDIIAARNAQGRNVLIALKPGGRGDITQTHVAWEANRGLPYVPSPLFYDGRVYLIKDGGMMSSFDAKTGKPYYLQERLGAEGSYYASLVAAAGRIYVASLAGKVTVVKTGGDKPEIINQGDFGDRIFATPALVGNRIYLRTQKRLYALGGEN